ncbi:MAG: hypothetical protein V1701_10950 [Planctomycetota bacterium]
MKLLHTIKNIIIVLLGGIGVAAACFGLALLLYSETTSNIISNLAYFFGGSIIFVLCAWKFHMPLYILAPFSVIIACCLGLKIEEWMGHCGKPGGVFIFTLIILPIITLRLVTKYYQRQKQPETQEVQGQPKSILVNTLSEIFIILGIVSVSIYILIGVVLFFEDSPSLMEAFPDFGIGFLVLTSILITSIALSKRKNWARIIFIGGSALSIVYFIRAIWQELYDVLHPRPLSTIDIMCGDWLVRDTMANHLFSIALYVVIIIILGWIIKKLVSGNIPKEFTSPKL